MQLLDELSMIYLSSTTFYAMFSFNKSTAYKSGVLLFTISLSVFVTLYYHYLKDPLFHQNTFAILTATVIFKGVYEMESLLRYDPTGPVSGLPKDKQEKAKRQNASIHHTMRVLAFFGVAAVGFGFLLWTLDNVFCSRLRSWRRAIGLPWGLVLEGHGWW